MSQTGHELGKYISNNIGKSTIEMAYSGIYPDMVVEQSVCYSGVQVK